MTSEVAVTVNQDTAVAALFARRSAPTQSLSAQAAAIVAACADMAERFRRGGMLLVLGTGAAATDAQHVAVEFLHPVLVGKRALPARHVVGPAQLTALAGADDIVLAVSAGALDADVLAALGVAHHRGALSVALVGAESAPPEADHVLRAGGDQLAAQEMQVTTYHLLWELVHVQLEHGDLVAAPACSTPEVSDSGCITCGDVAVPGQVLRLLGNGLALVDTGKGPEEVSVALVDAAVGDTILVHAREAIGRLDEVSR